MKSFVTLLLKSVLYLLLLVVIVTLGVGVAIQVPAVQTEVVQRVADRLSAKLGFPVAIGHVSIKWFDAMSLSDITILDYARKPMIDVGRLDVNYDLPTLFRTSSQHIHLDEAVLYRPTVTMRKNPNTGDTNLDEFIARIEELTTDPTKPFVPDQHVPFTIGRVRLIDGTYTLDDPREPVLNNPNRFDYNHFTLQRLTADVRNFLVLGDTISLNIRGLSGIDKGSRLPIRRLDSDFLYCAKKMELGNLLARIGTSTIRDNITFLYDKPAAFSDFNAKVLMRAQFENSVIQAKDLGLFSDYIANLNETWRLSGQFVGTVHDFVLRNTNLQFGAGSRSRLAGTLAWKGLPDLARTTVDFRLTPSTVFMDDIRQYYPDPSLTHTLQKLGTVTFDAHFAGAFDNFRTEGNFKTALGQVSGQLALALGQQSQPIRYTADLNANDLAIGKLLDQPDLGSLTGKGKLSGTGASLAQANLNVDGQIERIGWQGYEYRHAVVRGNLQKRFFNGQVSVRDPNLAADLDGEFDLTNPVYRYDVHGNVQQANLRALGLTADSISFNTAFNIQLEGNELSKLTGRAAFQNGLLTWNKRRLPVDTLLLTSSIEQNGTQRFVSVDSEFLTTQLQGNFDLSRVATDLQQLVNEYRLYFAGNVKAMQQYYTVKTQTPRHDTTDYFIDYQLTTKQSSPLLALLEPTWFMAPNSRLEGRLTMGRTAYLTTTLRTDSLYVRQIGLGPTEVDLTSSKFVDNPAVLASAVVTSARQRVGSRVFSQNWQVEASWANDHIDFSSRLDQAANRAALSGGLWFKGDAIDLTFGESKLRLLDGDWSLSPQSAIRKVGKTYYVQNLLIQNGDQQIKADGKLSADSSETLHVEAHAFRLASLNPLLNTRLGGTLNGTAAIRDLYDTPIVESELTIHQLSYDSTHFGDLRSRNVWDTQAERLNIAAQLNRNGNDVLTLLGNYTPSRNANPLALSATVTNADLNILETLSDSLFTQMGGTANGQLTVRGTPAAPVLNGTLHVSNGRGRFEYLKADFTFDDDIFFGENEISTRQLTLRDPTGNTAVLHGGVYHDRFRYFNLGIGAELKNFRIMNTTVSDNDLFYGQGVVTGRAELVGPLENLVIRANVTSNKGTRIYIPLDGTTYVNTDEAIRFVSRNRPIRADSAIRIASSTPDLSRIQMDFNFDITPDAYCEIQLDRQTGDIIKAYGQGRLAMKVDTKGDFTMTGNYEIREGDYTFTFQNVINKRFQIRPNSRISWTGDPYGALLDVTAAYTQYTSLSPLLPMQSSGTARSSDQTRRYPVDLVIKISGELEKPTISYDLDIKEYPTSSDFRQAVSAFENKLQSNDQELTRQVSSVLLFNQLLPEGSGFFEQGMVNAGVANSVSELLSNQISRLASSLNDNLDVGVSFGGFTGSNSLTNNDNLLNNLQLRFSYRLLNDRLRISRDGGFTYGQSQYNAASLLGEWTLEYWLTPDGRLRAKMYNRNQQNSLSQYTLYNSIMPAGGLSLLYTRSFNRLFGPKRSAPGLLPAIGPGQSGGGSFPGTFGTFSSGMGGGAL